jgi:hypothetical protein
VITIKYEELTNDPQGILTIVMQKLGLQFEEQQLETTSRTNDKRATYKHFFKLNEPVNNSSQGRWKSELSDKDILTFNKIAAKELNYFGYI